MITRRTMKANTLIKLLNFKINRHLHLPTTDQTPQPPNSITPVNPTHLLRVCTILYQQQSSPDSRLQTHLQSTGFDLTHEFFLQVCNSFPSSWRPIYRFFQFTHTQHPNFHHTSVTFNKMLDVVGKARNIDLFWELAQEIGRRGLANDKTFRIGLKTLASARELRKCVEFFHVMNGYGCGYSVASLNKVVECLSGCKLVEEAKFVVLKLRDWIRPNGLTYRCLIKGFCEVGDLIEASKLWNLMVDEGFEPEIDVVEKMMESFFKINQYDEALKLFQTMRCKRMNDLSLSSYRLVINWMCKRGKVSQAQIMYEEMQKRGIQADNLTLGYMIYGLLSRARVREAYRVVNGIEKPDISVYHEFIKGLLRLKRTSEATQVFREMIKRGCEPTMHTYVMLLQGHLGRRGRKGKDPLVNFDSICVGGLVKVGKSLDATKYVERVINRKIDVPRFDYNKFLYYYSTDEGVVMFAEVGKKLREAGLVDLADIFERYGEKMATRDRRRIRTIEP